VHQVYQTNRLQCIAHNQGELIIMLWASYLRTRQNYTISMKETFDYLDDSESTDLRATLKSYYASIFSVGLATLLIFLLYYSTWTNKLPNSYLIIIVFVFFILLYALARHLSKNLRLDIDDRQKKINEYVIEQKDSYLDKGPGIGGWNTKYYFISESRKITIKKDLYDTAEIGDSLLEHFALNSQELLKYEIKKNV